MKLSKIASRLLLATSVVGAGLMGYSAHASNGGSGPLYSAELSVLSGADYQHHIIFIQGSSLSNCQFLVNQAITAYTYHYAPTNTWDIPVVVRACQGLPGATGTQRK